MSISGLGFTLRESGRSAFHRGCVVEASGAAAPFFGDFVGESRVLECVVGPLRVGDAETFVSGGAAEVDLDGEVGGAPA